MKHTAPEFAIRFECVCGSCPDTCCRDWQIIPDEESRSYYSSLTGALGETVRSAIVPEDEPYWRLDDRGFCVLLDKNGLCTLQRELGEQALCSVCRKYPRFTREYGALREEGVSLSCPEAMRLLLTVEDALALRFWESGTQVRPNDLDPELFFAVKKTRETAFSLLEKREYSARERIALLLYFASAVQYALDGGNYDRVRRLCGKYGTPVGQKAVLKDAKRYCLSRDAGTDTLFHWTGDLRSCEILTTRWENLLDTFRQALLPLRPESYRRTGRRDSPETEDAVIRILTATLYKYWIEAADDGKLLVLVKQAVWETLLMRELVKVCGSTGSAVGDFIEIGHLAARELEHNDDNLKLLRTLLENDSAYSVKAMLRLNFR